MTRLDAISAYAEKERIRKKTERENAESQLNELRKLLCDKKERIKQLCDTANACMNTGIVINYDASTGLPPQYAYEKGCFASSYVLSACNGSLLGFQIASGCPVTTIGFSRFYINNDTNTRAFIFETDGEKIHLSDSRLSDIKYDTAALIAVIRDFLDKFDYFEEKFYEYVDNIVGYNESED